jgi:hypothetical protein
MGGWDEGFAYCHTGPMGAKVLGPCVLELVRRWFFSAYMGIQVHTTGSVG